MSRLLFAASLLLPAAAAAQDPAPRPNCDAIYEQVEPAYARADTEALRALYAEAADCGRAFRDAVGARAARVMLEQARSVIAADRLAEAERTLSESLGYARQWQALATLGDLHHEGKRYDAAARYYQEALEEIRDEASTPTPPPSDVIERIFRLAEQARLLADEYVAVANRSTGAPGGLAASSIRGFVPVAVALPVTFEFDSTELTPQGRQAAADLLRMLEAENAPAVTLIGHADPTGADAYNLALSARRAEALGDYLERNGFDGVVRTEGRGEREPLDVDQAERYTQDELYQMYRRVELRRE